jgi:PIN domain nuclease of toxin-antitoxin system
MKLIIDTHILLWAAAGELPSEARRFIEDMDNTLFFSPASIWEIVIKHGLGRNDFIVNPSLLYNGFLSAGYKEMTITGRHTLHVSSLPLLHKDPFDRFIIAQSISEGIPLLTSDDVVAQYSGSIILVK